MRLNEQTAVASRTLAQREQTLKLVTDRVNAGLDTRLELRHSEGGLSALVPSALGNRT